MDDRKIKELLYCRSERALDEIGMKYSRLYRQILRQMLDNESDVEECANDVLLAVWNSIPPNDPANLSAYIVSLARYIGINRLKFNKRKKRDFDYTVMLSELGDSIPAPSGEPSLDGETVRRVLSDFVGSLKAEERVLFLRRYVVMESVSSLAARFEISEGAVSVKLFRIRQRLKKKLKKEGISI